MNFLPVGHTHEDIDGLFGVLSTKLSKTDVFTPHEMIDLFLGAQRDAAAYQSASSREGLGRLNGHLPNDEFDSKITTSVPDWREFFARPVSTPSWPLDLLLNKTPVESTFGPSTNDCKLAFSASMCNLQHGTLLFVAGCDAQVRGNGNHPFHD